MNSTHVVTTFVPVKLKQVPSKLLFTCVNLNAKYLLMIFCVSFFLVPLSTLRLSLCYTQLIWLNGRQRATTNVQQQRQQLTCTHTTVMLQMAQLTVKDV